jgi:DNA-directed RNA polymerase subunit L
MKIEYNFESKKKYDIKVSEIEYVKVKDYSSSWLHLNFTGNDINLKLLNSLRRVSMDDIPTYAIPAELIKFSENTSIPFDNGQLTIRWGFLPIFNVDPEIIYLSDIYYKNINFADPNRIKHPDEKKIDLYLDVHNDSNNIKFVTTNDLSIYIEEKESKMYDNNFPILLVKLQPNDTIKCHMKAVLGIGNYNVRFRASKNSISVTKKDFEEYNKKTKSDDDSKYDNDDVNYDQKDYVLGIESAGQIKEYEILFRSCEYLIKKLEDIKNYIKKMFDSKEIILTDVINLTIDNEDHTIGEIINYELQNHEKCFYSGLSKPDHLIKSITIRFSIEGNALKVITEVIDNIIDKYKYIGNILKKLE